jgi:hypothetical protein
MSARSPRTRGGYTTFTATSGSGAATQSVHTLQPITPMQMNNQAIILTLYVVVPGATVRVIAVQRIAAKTCPVTAAATAAFGSVPARTAYNELPVLDLGLGSLSFAFILSRRETALCLDPFSGNEDAPFPMALGEFIRFNENAVQ